MFIVEDTSITKEPDGAAYTTVIPADFSRYPSPRYKIYEISEKDWEYMLEHYGHGSFGPENPSFPGSWCRCVVGPTDDCLVSSAALNGGQRSNELGTPTLGRGEKSKEGGASPAGVNGED